MLGFDFPKCLFHRKFDTKQTPAQLERNTAHLIHTRPLSGIRLMPILLRNF